MLDFTAIRRRAECFQEREGLGSDGYALSQHVLELLAELKESNKERDEARELHAQVCAKYADACMRLHRISNIIAGYQSAHARDSVELGPDKEAAAMNGRFVGTVLGDGYAVGE